MSWHSKQWFNLVMVIKAIIDAISESIKGKNKSN